MARSRVPARRPHVVRGIAPEPGGRGPRRRPRGSPGCPPGASPPVPRRAAPDRGGGAADGSLAPDADPAPAARGHELPAPARVPAEAAGRDAAPRWGARRRGGRVRPRVRGPGELRTRVSPLVRAVSGQIPHATAHRALNPRAREVVSRREPRGGPFLLTAARRPG